MALPPATTPGGSSPRMRGALGATMKVTKETGIIPADAGSTQGTAPQSRRRRDHPRGCGEHAWSSFTALGSRGSSPRMRGALSKMSLWQRMKGIIPADAGSTPRIRQPPRYRQDHPRGCGEHVSRDGVQATGGGSSPRMRGAHYAGHAAGIAGGIIPADAGSTISATLGSPTGGDHPRGCGEHRP